MGISNYNASLLLASSFLTTTYLALVTTAVTPDQDGTNISEPLPTEYANYTREAMASVMWGAPGEIAGILSITNVGGVFFNPPPNTSPGCTVVGWVLLDSLTAGNMLFYGSLPPSIIASAITPIFNPNSIIIGLF